MKRDRVEAPQTHDDAHSNAENAPAVAKRGSEPLDFLSEAADERRKIAKVSAEPTANVATVATGDAHTRALQAQKTEETLEDAMRRLNETFVAFVTQQLALHPDGDFTKAAEEYVEYVRQLRAKFLEVEPTSDPRQVAIDGSPDLPPDLESEPEAESSPRPALAPPPTEPTAFSYASDASRDQPTADASSVAPFSSSSSGTVVPPSTAFGTTTGSSSAFPGSSSGAPATGFSFASGPTATFPSGGFSSSSSDFVFGGFSSSSSTFTPSGFSSSSSGFASSEFWRSSSAFTFGGLPSSSPGFSSHSSSGFSSGSQGVVQPQSFSFGSGGSSQPSQSWAMPSDGSSMPLQQQPQDGSQFNGFLASANPYGAASIWNDSTLLQLRMKADTIEPLSILYHSADTEVWKGLWKETTPIAIKRLPPARQTMANALVLASNVKTVASLSHPRIVSLVCVHWDKATEMQVASELMDGGDLRSVLDSMEVACTLTWATFKCQVAIDIADALSFVHAQPLQVTFSCLPSSRKVLLSSDGRGKLNLVQGTDLGYQRRMHQVRYMAPEVIKGAAFSSSSDLYAFGVLLCELDTTRPPYEDAIRPDGAKMSDELVAHHVVSGLLTPQPSKDCPELVAKLITQCTAYDPSGRLTVASIAYALRGIFKNEL